MAKVIAVCTSEEKGTVKEVVAEGVLREGYGLLGDAHADSSTHRQVCLLAVESIDKMRNLGLELGPGDLAENLTTEGISLHSLPVGTCLSIGDQIVLEVSQIGKECHKECTLVPDRDKCIVLKEGIFARVIRGGSVKAGDPIRTEEK